MRDSLFSVLLWSVSTITNLTALLSCHFTAAFLRRLINGGFAGYLLEAFQIWGVDVSKVTAAAEGSLMSSAPRPLLPVGALYFVEGVLPAQRKATDVLSKVAE